MGVANSLDDLLEDINGSKASKDWDTKMVHKIPEYPVVVRHDYIIKKCVDKIVLNVGSDSGILHSEIGQVAKTLYGLDMVPKTENNYICFDLETCATVPLPTITGVELVVAGEIIEHLSNPGHALRRLNEAYKCPLLVTVPNAFNSQGFVSITKKSVELVNTDHVSYYSYWTLKRLLERHGYEITETGWYNGKPMTAEGLVMLAKPTEN